MSTPRYHPGLPKAHDVRHMVICPSCGRPGDDRYMADGMHGSCIFDRGGIDALLALPEREANKLCMADVGPDAMRALISKRRTNAIRNQRRMA